MIDGIIKADGTSRLMRANLPATYGEFKAQAAAGTLPLDVLFNAVGWSQFPTFLNKANLLRDNTAALFGLGALSVPDDVFSMLSPVTRHWWSRWVPGTMSWQEERSGTTWNVQINNKSYNYTWEYADAINIDQNDGAVSLINPVSITFNSGQSEDVVKNTFRKLKGKYCHSYDSSPNYIFYFPDDSDQYLSWGNNTLTVQAGHAFTISSVYASTPIGDKTFLSSANRDAYPDSGVVDGYEYSYLGIPWENARTPVRIATGSYKGTGTYGEANKNVLKLDFEPKLVFLSGVGIGDHGYALSGQSIFNHWNTGNYAGNTQLPHGCSCEFNGNEFKYYNGSQAAYQFNISGRAYNYIAFG